MRGKDNDDLLQFIALLSRPTVCSPVPWNSIFEVCKIYCISHVLLGRGIWAELHVLETVQRKTSHLCQGQCQGWELGQTIAWTKLNKLSFSALFSSISAAAGVFLPPGSSVWKSS